MTVNLNQGQAHNLNLEHTGAVAYDRQLNDLNKLAPIERVKR